MLSGNAADDNHVTCLAAVPLMMGDAALFLAMWLMMFAIACLLFVWRSYLAIELELNS